VPLVELGVGVSSHFLQYLFAEDFGWGLPSKTLSRRVVEAITDHLHIVICALPDVAFAGRPPSKASVRVLDFAFLPGAGGVAKPRLGSDLGLEMRPTDKLGSTIKSDGPAGGEGEVFDRLYNLSPLGRFVSQIACLAVNGQIATMRDIIGAEQDTDITVEFGFSASSGATWSPDDTVGR
jgi:hypothetical protein